MDLKKILLIAGFILLFLAVKTLLPGPGASKVCRLGYKATCSFTPFSSFILLGMSGLVFYFRIKL
jgi:hypothetical protein